MEIIKSLKDYNLTPKQRIFASFLKESISSYTCTEGINNPAYIRQYFSPKNDFYEYTTGIADPSLLLRRVV